MTSQRTFPRPPSLETLHLSEQPVLDELELVAWHETEAALWSRRVLKNEQNKILKPMLTSNPRLPEGLLAAGTDSLVIGLTRDGLLWEDGKWVENDEMWGATTSLSADDVAFVARAFSEGCESVLFRPYFPLAFIPDEPITAAAPKPVELPPGSRLIAIVDDLDKTAVLELIALAPGPTLLRRHDGKWYEDEDWLIPLRSIDPPSIVVLDDALGKDVIGQVDEATKGMEFEPKIVKSKKVRASAFQDVDEWIGDLEERVILAVAKSVEGVKGTEKLKRYWTIGEGGLTKIRWGTPGSWTRCRRHLVKYIGPRAAGYCTNLCQRMGGFGVACHVGVRGDAAPMVAVATYTPEMFRLKKKSGSSSSNRTPYARAERKTTRELTDAEIEQRREAARKSALARRKAGSDDRAAIWKTAPLMEKVKMAAEIEQAAIARREELESALRAADDPATRAEIQGELDDLRDMLSAKDEWLRNARFNELKLADQQIDKQEAEMDSVRDSYRRNIDSLHDQQRGLDLQIEAARAGRVEGKEENAARNREYREEAQDMREKAATLRERAKYTSSEVQRIELQDQARRLDGGASEREAEVERFEDTTGGHLEKLEAKRRGVRNKISDMNTRRTRTIANMQRNLSQLRDKRSRLTDQFSEATEYLRRARGSGTGTTSRHREGQFLV
jgi:hypothetical protein